MIQRVQTLFLLGVAIAMALMFVLPLWEKSNGDQSMKMELDVLYLYEYQKSAGDSSNWSESSRTPVFYIGIAAGLSSLLALIAIFRFKNRPQQIRINALGAFTIMATLGIAAYFIYMGENELGFQQRGIFKPGFFLPVGSLILISLANRFIKKDDALVKSVDRIR
jgi:hypothetical protein